MAWGLKTLLSAAWFGLASLALTPAHAATYYVQPGGSDTNAGTGSGAAQAWKTIQKAAASLHAGDTVNIAAGTYTGTTISPANSGTSSAPITYNGAAGAFINGPGIYVGNKSYINIQNLMVENVAGVGIAIYTSSNINVTGCTIYHTNSSGIAVWGVAYPNNPGTTYPSHNIFIGYNQIKSACVNDYNECITIANGVSNTEIRGNVITNPDKVNSPVGGEGIDVKLAAFNIWIDGNDVSGLYDTAVMPDGATLPGTTAGLTNIYIWNNRIHDNHSNGLTIEAEWYGSNHNGFNNWTVGPVENVQVYNNLIYNNDLSGIDMIDYGGGGPINDIWLCNNALYNNNITNGGTGAIVEWYGTNVHVNNNISFGNQGWAIYTPGGASVDYNLVDDWNWYTNVSHGSNDQFMSNPNLVNPNGGDFHLTSSSTLAIGKGAASGIAATGLDLAGNPRPTPTSGYDIGAYQYMPVGPVANGTYKVLNHWSGLGMDDTGNGGIGTQLCQWAYGGAANQQWIATCRTIDGSGAAWYTLQSKYNSAYISNNSNTSNASAVLLENPSTFGASELWQLQPFDGTYYRLVNKQTGMMLDTYSDYFEGAASDSAHISLIQAYYNYSWGQEWSFAAP